MYTRIKLPGETNYRVFSMESMQVPDPVPDPDPGAPRNAVLQPYATSSYVNQPIKTGATRTANNLDAPPNGALVVDPILMSTGIGGRLRTLTPIDYYYNNDPVTDTRHVLAAGAPRIPAGIQLRVTDDLIHDGKMNGLFVAPDSTGRYVYGGQALDRRTVADDPKIAYYGIRAVDIYGSGLPTDQQGPGRPGGHQGHGGSGLPIFGLTIRDWEWNGTANITHELCLNVAGKYLSAAAPPAGIPGGLGYKSPADRADAGFNKQPGDVGYAEWEVYAGTNVHMRNGALLALPAAYDFAAQGITNAQALRFGWTLKNFGFRIGDITGKVERFAFSAQSNIENAIRSAPAAFHNQVIQMILACDIITNDAPGQWGGTGTPLVTPPPELVLP